MLDPPPGGNGNGRFDRGETADLEMSIKNIGTENAENVTAVVRAFHDLFIVTDSTADYGTVAVGSTRVNTGDRFTAEVDLMMPEGMMVPCSLYLHSDNLDADWALGFRLQVGEPMGPGALLLDHDTGYCALTVTCLGSIGSDRPMSDGGRGFEYPVGEPNVLRMASFAVGNSEDYVADRFYGWPSSGRTNQDFEPVDSLHYLVPAAHGDQHIYGSFNDAAHPVAKDIEIAQHSYQVSEDGYDDFVVLEYVVRNAGAGAVNGLYAGIFADFDIGDSLNNSVQTDTVRRLAYMRKSLMLGTNVGVKVLYPQTAANVSAIDHELYVNPDSCMTDAHKYRFLSGATAQRRSHRNGNWSVVTSVGPFDLAPGASEKVAIAFVGGSTEFKMLEHADSAQSWYRWNVGVSEAEQLPDGIAGRSRLQLSPNPFSQGTWVRYSLERAGACEFAVYDIAGELVERVGFAAARGDGSWYWRPTGIAQGVYLARLTTPDGESAAKVLVLD